MTETTTQQESRDQARGAWLEAIRSSHTDVLNAAQEHETKMAARRSVVAHAVDASDLSASAIGAHIGVSHVTVLRWLNAR